MGQIEVNCVVLFEIELFMCIKMDLALNNLQRLISYKTQLNQTTLHATLLFTFFFCSSMMTKESSAGLQRWENKTAKKNPKKNTSFL